LMLGLKELPLCHPERNGVEPKDLVAQQNLLNGH